MQRRLIGVATLVVLLLFAPSARGQCGDWAPGDGVPGVDGFVQDIIQWDPDGAGPAEPMLVAAGDGIFGDFRWRGVVAWTGGRWVPLGAQVSGPSGTYPQVNALAVYNGQLIAAGEFERLGALVVNDIARWDGNAWQPLGTGIGSGGSINALAVFGNSLYVGGNFNSAGGNGARGVARWNGTNWYSLGNTAYLSVVYALTVHQNALIIGGSFAASLGNYLLRWTGSEFQSIDGSPSGAVYALWSEGDDLFIGGDFTIVGGVPAARVAVWDGRWHSLGAGLSNQVYSLATYHGDLIAGVRSNPGLFRWDGNAWSSFAGGIECTRTEGRVEAIVSSGNDLIIAGWLFVAAGGHTTLNIAGWDGASWNRFGNGFDAPVQALTLHDGLLVAAGDFRSAGDADVVRVAGWDGQEWSPLGAGLDGAAVALTVHNDQIVAGGNFTHSGGTSVRSIARFNGSAWEQIGDGLAPTVSALAVHNGNLIAARNMSSADGHVLSWDGAIWRPLGPGFSGSVNAVLSHKGELFAAGSFFFTIDGTPMQGIARWDGQAWLSVGLGFNSVVHCLGVHAGELIAGGYFTVAGNSPAQGVAGWDGTAWHGFGAGVGRPLAGRVFSVASFDGNLFVGGAFDIADGTPASNIARWDGRAWQALGAGLSEPGRLRTEVRALMPYARTLAVGGDFLKADGAGSAYFARWVLSPCAGDFNCDGVLDSRDFFDYVAAFFTNAPGADFDRNGVVDSQDFFDFLALFFAGC